MTGHADGVKTPNSWHCLPTKEKIIYFNLFESFSLWFWMMTNCPLRSSTGIIHGDLNHQNILVKPVDGEHHEITGVLDFSMLSNAYFVFDVSISIAYMMMESPRPLDVGGALLAGYESILPLSDVERNSVYPLVLGRMCLSLVNGRISAIKYPENSEYLLATAKSGTRVLNLLWSLGKQEVEKKWFSDASKYSALSGQLWCVLRRFSLLAWHWKCNLG